MTKRYTTWKVNQQIEKNICNKYDRLKLISIRYKFLKLPR